MKIKIGYCWNCDSPIYDNDNLVFEEPNVYFCSDCGKSNNREDLVLIPEEEPIRTITYIIKKNKEARDRKEKEKRNIIKNKEKEEK